jgi:hypothetical protein
MTKRYSFECYDEDDQTTTRVDFETENDAWSGYDGPMWKFFDFLKGCGFVFDMSSTIGIMDQNDEFSGANDE